MSNDDTRAGDAMNTDSAINAGERSVWQRCWCYRFGRCLVACPTADLPPPIPLTDDAWRAAYDAVMGRS